MVPVLVPLTPGAVHFLRWVQPDRTITLLNLAWAVPRADPNQEVWATLTLTVTGAWLRIYDTAPDAPRRTLLAEHPFPLKEAVQLRRDTDQERPDATVAFFEAAMDRTVRSWFRFFSTMS